MIEIEDFGLSEPGKLRAAINLGNILLVTGKNETGNPTGVSPSMAAAIARHLGFSVVYNTYPSPGAAADAVDRDEWDICLIAEDPKRAETIEFCGAYAEIEATYLVPAGSKIQSIEEVDQPGIRIAVSERSAYDLYLSRALKHAELKRAPGLAAAFELFQSQKLDVLAGLRPALLENAESLPGSRVLDGAYTAVRQAVGVKPGNPAFAKAVKRFVSDAKSNGLVAGLINEFGQRGRLSVAS
ncbi:MAG: transporter substrate-binding domain-containing protein [Nisaea sp.]|jgi:polar amino acid transport system substrate-binding protein|uniref:transporter substrate-binding domain-containing protein n=1 Tax=Nisaea sp. TaxID=2024842 RepID=UPI001B16BF31|nr:transporter substrate-binding domain-containing protein [Nisaea sp.]MBO6561859.1 transporter substrate-binding domain-containing protein [Nisaea sp.]